MKFMEMETLLVGNGSTNMVEVFLRSRLLMELVRHSMYMMKLVDLISLNMVKTLMHRKCIKIYASKKLYKAMTYCLITLSERLWGIYRLVRIH